MRKPFIFLIVTFLMFLDSRAHSGQLETDGSGRVVEIVDGDTLIFEDGREVRLDTVEE